jgi:hypothetical protein
LLLAAAREVQSGSDPSWGALSKRVSAGSKEAVRPHLLTIIARYRKRNTAHGVKDFTTALETDVLPRLRQSLEELTAAQSRATHNQDIYLTWDHMDVYFATSMRKRWEFEDLYDFVSQLMGRPELAELNLRYFDPTQSFTPGRVDKGLVEALMLRRAKCTVYSVQDTDTFGKDSELAATLAQGKPVVAYVPTINVDQRSGELCQGDPGTIQERLRFLAYADAAFASSLSQDDLAFVRNFKALEEFEQIWITAPDDKLVAEFRQNHQKDIDRLCRILAASEKRLYDGRASTLINSHPLGLQVHLETGVANGVLVVRSLADCAELLRRVLTNSLQLIIEDNSRDRMWYLREKISGCAYRVVTQDAKLTNCFWNFYRR